MLRASRDEGGARLGNIAEIGREYQGARALRDDFADVVRQLVRQVQCTDLMCVCVCVCV